MWWEESQNQSKPITQFNNQPKQEEKKEEPKQQITTPVEFEPKTVNKNQWKATVTKMNTKPLTTTEPKKTITIRKAPAKTNVNNTNTTETQGVIITSNDGSIQQVDFRSVLRHKK